jgi:hypothetical protein
VVDNDYTHRVYIGGVYELYSAAHLVYIYIKMVTKPGHINSYQSIYSVSKKYSNCFLCELLKYD